MQYLTVLYNTKHPDDTRHTLEVLFWWKQQPTLRPGKCFDYNLTSFVCMM